MEIAYRDTDGKPQVLSILIDTVPPTVQIDNPVHKSEGQDTSPNFSGSFTDDSSGLREDTFRLYVDHNDDLERERRRLGDVVVGLAGVSTRHRIRCGEGGRQIRRVAGGLQRL